MWYQKITQTFKIPDIRKKIFFVLSILALFRVMANIPIPGINFENLENFFNQFQMFGLLNVFTGGALDKLSIVMLGLGPYITAVIIFQLLTMIFPALEKLYKEEGEAGRQKFNQYCRIATAPLAAIQGYGMLTLFQHEGVLEPMSGPVLFASIATITAGAMALMWLGELITEKGIGNGVSLLIFAGIISAFPNNVGKFILNYDPSQIPSYILFFVMAIAVIAGVTLVNEARRNIPISYARRIRGQKMYGGTSTYLPLSINPAGVMPIIFALSILLFPSMIASFLAGKSGIIGSIAIQVKDFFQNPWVYGVSYFALVFLFTYFYTAVTFDPKAISTNLQKMGGFIPGIRPGRSTSNFLNYILNRVLFLGGLFLGTIAIMPQIAGALTGVHNFNFLIGGTSLLIVVAVVLETWRQINAQLEMHEYEKF